MKVFINTTSWTISKTENDYPVLSGNNYVDKIEVYYDANPATKYFYPTILVMKPSGRTMGAFSFDVANPTYPQTYTDADSNTWYYYVFTLSSANGVLDVKGKFLITITTNLYEAGTTNIIGQRNANVQLNVLNAVINSNNDVLILGNTPDTVVASLYSLVQTLNTSVSNLSNTKYDKANIGYISLSGGSGTLTTAQQAEVVKDYCVVKYTDGDEVIYFYKYDVFDDGVDDTISFIQIDQVNPSSQQFVVYINIIRVDKGNGYTWTYISLSQQIYTQAYTDTLLAKKVNKTTTVNGHALSGNVTVTKSDVGLGNVDNTSDANKPISTATQNALNALNALIEASGHSLALVLDTSTYKIYATLKDANNNVISTSNVIDLPLESVVVSGAYDDATKKVVLTLQNGSTIEFSVADLVSGLQTEITAQNPLSSDLVDDTNHTHKFVTASEKAQIATNTSAISGIKDGTTIDSFADVESELATKQDTVSAGTGITIASNVISADDNYVSQASKDYTDNAIFNLKWELGSFDYEDATDTDVKYQSSVPSGTISANITQIGGMSYKVNQLVQNGNFEDTVGWSADYGTISVSNNTLTYTQTTASGSNRIKGNVLGTITNHKYLVVANINYLDNLPNNNVFIGSGGYDGYSQAANTFTLNTLKQCVGIFTRTSGGDDLFSIYPRLPNANDRVEISITMCFDLTAMYGSGNEPADVAAATTSLALRGIDITQYNAFDTGSIRNSAVENVVISGSGMTTITKQIPAEIQALTGYGYGVNSVSNYIDFANKKFEQYVGKNSNLGGLSYSWGGTYVYSEGFSKGNAEVLAILPSPFTAISVSASGNLLITFPSGSFSNTTEVKQALNGVIAYYELASTVETDISTYLASFTNPFQLTDDYSTITFDNTYNNAVPYSITYLKEVAK